MNTCAWGVKDVSALLKAAKDSGLEPRKAARYLSRASSTRSRLADQLRYTRRQMREEHAANYECVACGRDDMPLHTDRRCPNCHEEGTPL